MEKTNQPNPDLRIAVPTGIAHHYEPPPLPRPDTVLHEPVGRTNAAAATPVQDLSTVELVRQITAEVGLLLQKEIELAKTELKENLKAEAGLIGGLSIAALAAVCAVNLLLVTVALALALLLPAWAAGLVVSGALLLATAVIAGLAWSKRVRKPMGRTRRTLKDVVQWTKQRLV